MTTLPTLCIYACGILQLSVASANIFAYKKFSYRKHLTSLPPVMRQIFMVQNSYMMAIIAGWAALCFGFADELVSGHGMGLAISTYLALFWAVRVLLQFFYYDRTLRRANRVFDVMFIVADSYLAIAFALAALLPWIGTQP